MAEVNENNIFEAIKSIPKTDFAKVSEKFLKARVNRKSSTYDYMFDGGFIFKQLPSVYKAFEEIEEIRNSNPSRKVKNSLDLISGLNFENYNEEINREEDYQITSKVVVNNLLKNIKSFVNIGGLIKKDRIIPTEDKRGFFDFSLASQGLYRPIEFYSEQLKEEILSGKVKNPFELQGLPNGVVNPDFVEKRLGTYFFDKYSCIRRQRGTTDVYNNFSNICYIGTLNTGIEVTFLNNSNKVFNGKGKHKLKYASSNKKSYLIFQKKKENTKYVDIFLAYNFLNTGTNGNRLLGILPALLVAGALEEFGIKVRISVLRIGSDDNTKGEEVTTAISMPLKGYNESVQESYNILMNVMGKQTSAETFLGFWKTYEQKTSSQVSNPVDSKSANQYYFSDVAYNSESYMVEMLARYKNWSEENKDKDFIDTKVTNPNFQIALPISRVLVGDKLTYKEIIENLPEIIFKFYYYMDFLAIEMLSIQEFVEQIYTRFSTDKYFRDFFQLSLNAKELKKIVRDYSKNILTEKYRPVEYGAYADTQEQQEEKTKLFLSKVKFLEEALDNIVKDTKIEEEETVD